jgi:hypothetical protein
MSGCFHREHSPKAYELIDDAMRMYHISADGAVMEEHESGPEILVWLAVVAGTLNLATSIVNLVTAIVKARSEGIRKGDDRRDPVEIVVRGENRKGLYCEQQVLIVHAGKKLDEQRFHRQLDQAILELFGDNNQVDETKVAKR